MTAEQPGARASTLLKTSSSIMTEELKKEKCPIGTQIPGPGFSTISGKNHLRKNSTVPGFPVSLVSSISPVCPSLSSLSWQVSTWPLTPAIVSLLCTSSVIVFPSATILHKICIAPRTGIHVAREARLGDIPRAYASLL